VRAVSTASAPARSRVFIVDDHPVMLEGVTSALAADAGLALVGHATTAAATLEAVARLSPDIVVADLVFGGSGPQSRGDGLKLISELHRLHPTVKIVVFSFVEELELADRALEAGAVAYVSKSESKANLLLAIHTALTGGRYKSPLIYSTASRLTAGGNAILARARRRLTNRELQVLHAVGLGHSNRRIAADLELSVRTVESHKESLKEKFDLADTAALAELARTFAASL
jgi:DNA-binding NarL/FixJ family response regulator